MALEEGFGHDHVFFDIDDIHAGSRWESLLTAEVLGADVLVAAITPNWLEELQSRDPATDYVVKELSLALTHDVEILPILFPGTRLPTSDEVPEQIAAMFSRQAMDLDQVMWKASEQLIAAVCDLIAEDRDRTRRVAIAKATAAWAQTAGADEEIVGKGAGSKANDFVVLVSTERVFATRLESRDVVEFPIEDLFAVRYQGECLHILGVDDEIKAERIRGGVLTSLRNLKPDCDIRDGKPDGLLWRDRRIERARRHRKLDKETFATGGDKQGDSVLFVLPEKTSIVRRKGAQEGIIEILHSELSAVCHHRRSVWLLGPGQEHRLDNLPETEIEELLKVFTAVAPRARRFDRPPDRAVRENLLLFSSDGLAEQLDIDLDWTRDFRPTPEESIVLAVAKLHLMERDLEADPDMDDRIEKRKTVDAFVHALVSAFAAEVVEDRPFKSLKDLRRLPKEPHWSEPFRASVGRLEPEDARRALLDKELLEALMGSIRSRDRALILLVELASFYPWAKGTKFEKGEREAACCHLAGLLTGVASKKDFEYIDGELKSRADKYKQGVNWPRLITVIVGGTALGVLTGGMAAPLLGAAIGGSMGLGGAAATSAGLALLGGGSLAAGGAGMAGGMALVSAIGGVVGGGAGLAANRAVGMSREALLTEGIKLDLITELILLQERSEAHQAAKIVALLEGQSRALRDDIELLKTRPASESKSLREQVADRAKKLIPNKKEELNLLEERLEFFDGLRAAIAGHLDNFIQETRGWIDESNEAAEQICATADPSVLVVFEAVDGLTVAADRVARVVPALLVRDDGEPVASLIVDVLSGRTHVEGEDVLRKHKVKNEFLVEAGGAAIDLVCHPLIWGTVSAAFMATHLAISGKEIAIGVEEGVKRVLPAGATSAWLESMDLKFGDLANAVIKLLERESRQIAGEAAIDVAQGLRLTLQPAR